MTEEVELADQVWLQVNKEYVLRGRGDVADGTENVVGVDLKGGDAISGEAAHYLEMEHGFVAEEHGLEVVEEDEQE